MGGLTLAVASQSQETKCVSGRPEGAAPVTVRQECIGGCGPSVRGVAPLQFRSFVDRDVAQPGSALQWGCRGRGFKSRRPDSGQAGLQGVGLVVPAHSVSFAPFTSEESMRRWVLITLLLAPTACGTSGEKASATGGFAAELGVDTTKMTKMPSGLRYQDVTQGQGTEAVAGRAVTVHYTGWLPDGKKFDSSRDHGQPFTFSLGAGQVIAGWDQGVEGMRVGGRRKLVLPADLAYGEAGAPPDIPPGATLVFDVEVLEVK